MSRLRHPRSILLFALVAGGLFACRLVGSIECESSIDCPTSTPVCEDGLCRAGLASDGGPLPTDAGGDDAGVPDAGSADGGPDDAGPADAGLDAGPNDAGPFDAGPGDAGVPDSVPIAAPGGQVDFTGVLGPTDRTMMNRPSELCSAPSQERGPYYFDTFAVVNQSGQAHDVSVTVRWAGGDGYLLLFRGGFDPSMPTMNCAGGDDDASGPSMSVVPRFSLEPGELVVIVATTFSVQAAIPDYLVEVETLGGDAGVPDDAGSIDAGAADAGIEDAGIEDAGASADAGADAGTGQDAGPIGPSLLLTEVMDHPIDATVRYVEIFNAGDEDADLSNVRVRRYSNGQTFPTGSLQLAGTLAPGGVLVAARDAASFQARYGRAPDYASIVIDGNGNDVYELVDGVVVVDIYGEVGVDGAGDPWDYTDRVAKRALGITTGRKVWDAAEWIISANGEDASPGQRD